MAAAEAARTSGATIRSFDIVFFSLFGASLCDVG
jgi:hypothetical protein